MPPIAAVARSFHPSEEVEASGHSGFATVAAGRVHQLAEKRIVPRAIAGRDRRALGRVLGFMVEAALVKAVNAGDFAARVGLILGLRAPGRGGACGCAELLDGSGGQREGCDESRIHHAR